MTEIRRLPLGSILVPADRLRVLNEDQAKAIATSIKENGQFQPIAAHRSSAGARPYTLIFGLHRYRAHELLGLGEIDVIIRSASEAPMLEIAENLFRHDLTELDRATFTEEWFKLKGVKMGRPKKSDNMSDFLETLGLADLASKDLGFSGRTGRRLRAIANNIIPELKTVLRGTPEANNQAILLRLTKITPEDQFKIWSAVMHGASLMVALSFMKSGSLNDDRQQKAFRQFERIWAIMDRPTRQKVLTVINESENSP